MADDVEKTPTSPAEMSPVPPKLAPFGAPAAAAPAPVAPAPAAAEPAPAPAAAAPGAAASSTAGVSTIKLKPVIRRPQIRKPIVGGAKPPTPAPAPAAASATSAKKATQSLKAVTGPIPMQATLRKTGIIAEGILTPAQQQAAKSKTSRISLESAIGVAPAKEAPAPMKTIRLRRPTDLKPSGPAPLVPPAPKPAEPSADDAPTAATMAEEPAAKDETSVTQKKTLKLHRPGIGIKRPTIGAAPAAPAAPSENAADTPVSDLPPIGNLAPVASTGSGQSAGVPSWVAALSLITSIAALAAVGFLMWHLWQEGVGPVAGGNEMSFIQM